MRSGTAWSRPTDRFWAAIVVVLGVAAAPAAAAQVPSRADPAAHPHFRVGFHRGRPGALRRALRGRATAASGRNTQWAGERARSATSVRYAARHTFEDRPQDVAVAVSGSLERLVSGGAGR